MPIAARGNTHTREGSESKRQKTRESEREVWPEENRLVLRPVASLHHWATVAFFRTPASAAIFSNFARFSGRMGTIGSR